MNNLKERALKYHSENRGKITISPKVKVEDKDDLSLAYTPGVAHPCIEISNDQSLSTLYTSRGNIVAVITDGTSVLGLGDIGPYAAMPVMEGKCLLFKKFAGVDAFPICLDTKDPNEIIETIVKIAPSFGGINLEDISFPRCIEIEEALKKRLNIPVFHDDQHGTSIVVNAALINACRVVKKNMNEIVVVISGMGAAGSCIAKTLRMLGVSTIYAYNKEGIISKRKKNEPAIEKLLDSNILNSFDNYTEDTLASIVKGADVFIGVSVGNILSVDMINSMNEKPIVFALANPTPEITYEEVFKSKVCVYASGRSDYPNQINNVLAFPGLFKGVLKYKMPITNDVKIAVIHAIAGLVTDDEIKSDYIIPSVFNEKIVDTIVKTISELSFKK